MPIFTEPTTLPTTGYAGVLLSIDLPAPAVAVTVTRTDPDGSQHIVRSGNRARLTDGYAAVYDAEAPLGVLVTYLATPHNADGTDGVDVDAGSATVAVDVRPWLKSVASPHLSRQTYLSRLGWAAQAFEMRQAVMQVIGASSPVVVQDVELLPAGALSLMVPAGEIEDVQALLRSGVLLLQAGPGHPLVFEDVYLTRGSVSRRTVPGGWFELSMAVQQVTRPSTVAAPLRIPGRSSADWLATGITGEAALSMGWSYRQALENDPDAMPAGDAPVAGGEFGTSTFGTSAFGGT